jgi:MazG family protein
MSKEELRAQEKEMFDKVWGVVRRLRDPGGCPWDAEQTQTTLLKCLVDEVDEIREAVEKEDWPNLREELGDALWVLMFMAYIAECESRFTLKDVFEEVHAKMVRRHPHVFGDVEAKDSAEVLKNWEQIKEEEKQK